MNIKKISFKLLFSILCLFTIIFTTVITSSEVLAYGWGFSRNTNHSSPDIGKYQSIIEGTNSYYIGDINQKELYLTFDAGYDNGVLEGILKTLGEKNVKASFFVTGDFVKRFPDLLLLIKSSGHLICNHSYSHKSLLKLNHDQIKEELEKLEKAYFDLTGSPMAKCFRPPAGEFDRDSLEYLSSLGYKTIFWSMAHRDWQVNNQMSVQKTVEVVINNLHNGAIILLHSVSTSNRDALSLIIDECLKQGYTFKTVDQLK